MLIQELSHEKRWKPRNIDVILEHHYIFISKRHVWYMFSAYLHMGEKVFRIHDHVVTLFSDLAWKADHKTEKHKTAISKLK